MQNVALSFPPKSRADKTTFHFSILVGLIFGLIIIMLRIPQLANWYFIEVQQLKAADLPLIYSTIFAFIFCPLTVCLRARLEGLVAYKKKPGLFLAGQIVYLIFLTISGLILSLLRFPGNLIGPIGFIAANLIAAVSLHYLLISGRQIRNVKKSLLSLYKRS